MGKRKMNIMVFDVPASSGGALSVLNDFYNEVSHNSNREIDWFFVVSKAELEEAQNIKVLRFPWVKKSWLHRLYFDNFMAHKLIEKYNIDKVLSFQNIVVPRVQVPQILYLHQSLPFIDYKYSCKENISLWIYQNPMGFLIRKSINKAQKVIVQTNWMKEACIEQTGVSRDKIKVAYPKINTVVSEYFQPNRSYMKNFFFPSGGEVYKNHKIIIEACKKLKSHGIDSYRVIFTLEGNENRHIAALYREVKDLDLPVNFIGKISRKDVFELYAKSILLFPSYAETFGLPLAEAKLHKSIIFASDCPFSREILGTYENAYFFNPFNAEQLRTLMEGSISGDIIYKEPHVFPSLNAENGWTALLNELC